MRNHIIFAAGCAALLATSVHAQQLLWNQGGSLPYSRLGFSIAIVGDQNGNGTDDVLIGEPGDLGSLFAPGGGSAQLREGSTGACINIFYGQAERLLGTAVERLPDIDNDGVDEILIGSPGSVRPGFPTFRNGRVELFLGGFGSAGGGPGFSCNPAVSPTTPPDAFIDRGASPPGLAGDGFGEVIVALPDMDGDGVADFAVGAPNGDSAATQGQNVGYVEVFSGTQVLAGSATPLYRIDGVRAASRFGGAITSVGDMTGDGVPDIAIAAPDDTIGTLPLAGSVTFCDGSNGAPFYLMTGTANSRFGFSIENAGDLNGDGFDDIAAGSVDYVEPQNFTTTGRVHVLSGQFVASGIILVPGSLSSGSVANAPTIFELTGNDLYTGSGTFAMNDQLGGSIANVGDMNGDGLSELLIGSEGSFVWDPDANAAGNWPVLANGTNDLGMARLVSGADGTTIRQIYVENIPPVAGVNRFGGTIAGGGDLDGDGQLDFVIGAPGQQSVGPAGSSVYAYSADIEFGQVYGLSNPNSTGVPGTIRARGALDTAANSLRFECSNLPPNTNGLLFMGPLQRANGLPVGAGLNWILGGNTGLIRFGGTTTDAFGQVTINVDLSVPNALGLIVPFSRWNFQYYHRDQAPNGTNTVNFTNAISVGFF